MVVLKILRGGKGIERGTRVVASLVGYWGSSLSVCKPTKTLFTMTLIHHRAQQLPQGSLFLLHVLPLRIPPFLPLENFPFQ